MAITISGENNNDKILASDGVIDSLSSLNISGIATATTFVGNLTGNVTGDVGGNLTGNVTGNINNTTLLLQTGGYERVRITSDGKIGVGTDSPDSDAYIHIVGTDNGKIILEDNDNNGANLRKNYIGIQGSDNLILAADEADLGTSSSIRFRIDNTEKVRISSAGRVGIGTDSPASTLHTYSEGAAHVVLHESAGGYDSRLRIKAPPNRYSQLEFADDDADAGEIRYFHTDNYMSFHVNSNQERVRIDSAGHVMIGTDTEGFATYGDQFTIANAGHCGMSIRSGTSSYGTIYFSDGDDGSADEVRGFIDYNHSNNQLQIGTNAATKLRISSEGWVTKPEHPAFFATHTGTDGSTSNGDLIQLTTTRHNKGDCYSTSNYYFTAPVDGVYHFTGQVWAKNGSSNARWQFSYYNGSSWSSITQHGWHGNSVNKNDFMQNASITYYMNSGNRMGMRVDGSTLSYYRGGGGAAHTYFCGHLVG